MNASLDLKVLLSIPREILSFEEALFTCATNLKFFEINIPKSDSRSVLTKDILSLLM